MATISKRETARRALQRVREFAEDNGLSEAKVWDMIALGEIRAVKIGAATRIRSDDAQAWRDNLPERVT